MPRVRRGRTHPFLSGWQPPGSRACRAKPGGFAFGTGNAETELRRHADSSRFMQRNIRKFIAILLFF
ncbi:hypothetical protein [Burkholderia ubonensis]|uniref:hypothetical protein n=1 Tax=Burkholderia ubonensis TaxID=101571 RepID=UPI0012F886B2|nr:hypothetical protein [Burkholderia ubonensis]